MVVLPCLIYHINTRKSKRMNNIKTYHIAPSNVGNKTLYTTIVNRNNPTLPEALRNKYGETRYFSGIDAEIYFGDIFIDEAININFTLQQNSMPIFGYNSYIFDTCAQGARYISGSFTVNFTKSNYLYDVLNVLSVVRSGSTVSQRKTAQTVSKDQTHAMWDKCFDIVLSYGNYKVQVGSQSIDLSTMIALRGVYITGCTQNFGTSTEEGKNQSTGQIPISETYFFYARDIDYEPATQEEIAESQKVSKDDIVLYDITLTQNLNNSTYLYDLNFDMQYDSERVTKINSINMQIDNLYSFILTNDKAINAKKIQETFSIDSVHNIYKIIAQHLMSLTAQHNNASIKLSITISYDTDDQPNKTIKYNTNTLSIKT